MRRAQSRRSAIYQDGVVKPLGDVPRAQNQRVRLSVQPLATGDGLA